MGYIDGSNLRGSEISLQISCFFRHLLYIYLSQASRPLGLSGLYYHESVILGEDQLSVVVLWYVSALLGIQRRYTLSGSAPVYTSSLLPVRTTFRTSGPRALKNRAASARKGSRQPTSSPEPAARQQLRTRFILGCRSRREEAAQLKPTARLA